MAYLQHGMYGARRLPAQVLRVRAPRGDFRKWLDRAIPTVRECAPCAKHLYSLFKKR